MSVNGDMTVSGSINGHDVEFSSEETLVLIKNMASGLTAEHAVRSGSLMVTKIDGTDFTPVKGIKLTDAANGRRILDCINCAMEKCNLSVVAAVKSGTNLESIAAEKQRDNGQLDEQIQEKAVIEVYTYVKPEKELYESEAKEQFRIFKETLEKEEELKPEDERMSENDLRITISEKKEFFKNITNSEYYKELKTYTIKVKEQNEAKAVLSQLRKQQQRNNVLDAVIQSIIAAKTLIAKKVKGAVKDFPLLIEKLNERVPVHDGQVIKDSYNNDNLTGMYVILKRTYGEASLISVNSWLLNSLDLSVPFEVLKDKPEQGLNVILECLKEEEQIKLWEFMTKDIFFVSLLLRVYQSNHNLYSSIAHEAMRYIRQMELGQQPLDDSSADHKSMPIFSHLSSHIKDVVVKTKEFAKKGERQSGKASNNGGKYEKPQKGLELAASANEKPNDNQNIKLRLNANMSFNREVLRSEMIGYTHANGNQFLYTATKEACKQCVTKKTQHSDPRCYTRSCKKCNLYGHTEPYCKQVIQEAGNTVEQDNNDDSSDEESCA